MGSVSIGSLAKNIISRYDHNRNGVVDIPTRRKGGDERTRLEVQHSANAIDYYTWEHSKLFRTADTDRNGQVTRGEIENQLRRFDTNGDGQLQTRGWVWNPKAEYDFYDEQLGEELYSHQHVPLGPPVPPIPVPHPHRGGRH